MSEKVEPDTRKRYVALIALAWLIMIGFDFLLHAGLLASVYREPHPFLLPMEQAFRLIPVGYVSFLLLAVLLMWLMHRLDVRTGMDGFRLGLTIGVLAWGSFCLGLYSISPAPPVLLMGWFVGQSIEMGLGGLVIGTGRSRDRIGGLTGLVVLAILLLLVLGVVLQNLMNGSVQP